MEPLTRTIKSTTNTQVQFSSFKRFKKGLYRYISSKRDENVDPVGKKEGASDEGHRKGQGNCMGTAGMVSEVPEVRFLSQAARSQGTKHHSCCTRLSQRPPEQSGHCQICGTDYMGGISMS